MDVEGHDVAGFAVEVGGFGRRRGPAEAECAVGRDPETAARQLARQIGNHRTVRSRHEADQARFIENLAGHQILTVSIDQRLVRVHERRRLPSRVAGRFEVFGEDLKDVQQQASAQYVILTKADQNAN